MKTYRLIAQLILVLVAIFCGLATPVAASPAVPICAVLALGFSALLVPEGL